jgi:HTH-type transcriptional regulator / antitoxin HigA
MIKPIRTADDLARAKADLAGLIRAEQTAAHDDQIQVMSALIEQFEQKAARIDAPSPIAAIKFRMEQMGLTTRQLEPYIGSRARVYEVLSGKRQLSIDMIRSLHEGLGIPYESLISKRSAPESQNEPSAPALNRLRSFGFDVSADRIDAFLSPLRKAHAGLALHRKTRTQRAASKMDQGALMLWQAAVLKKSEDQLVASTYDPSAFQREHLRRLARLSAKPDGPARAIKALAELGISTVVLPPLPETFLDGAALMGARGNPVIGLTLRHDRLDNFWFTLLHECAHISLHYDHLVHSGAAFVDDLEVRSDDRFELEADELAGESLIPRAILSKIPWDKFTTLDEVIALSVQAQVHIAVAAGRWQRDHQNYKKFSRLIERGTLRNKLLGDHKRARGR